MFCTNCGSEMGKDVKVCSKCGQAVIEPQNQHAGVIKSPVFDAGGPLNNVIPDYKNNSTAPKPVAPQNFFSKQNIVKRAIQFVALLVVVGIGIYSGLDKDSVKTNNEALKVFDSGNNTDAITQLKQAAETAVSDETKVQALKNLGYVYESDSKNDLALSTFKQALTITSSDTYDYYLISAEIALLEKDAGTAQINYTKAYEKNPNDFQINNALTLFYLDLDGTAPKLADYKKALTYAKRASELSTLAVAKENLAIAYYFNDDFNNAITLLMPMDFKSKPYDAYWIGLAYAGKKDVVNAKLYFQKAIDGGMKVPQEINDYIKAN